MHATSRLVALLSFVLSLSLILTKKRKNYRNSVSKSWVARIVIATPLVSGRTTFRLLCDPAMCVVEHLPLIPSHYVAVSTVMLQLPSARSDFGPNAIIFVSVIDVAKI